MRIFLTGAQGTGKSTLVDMLMKELPWLEKSADVTRDLVKSGKIKKEETSKGATEKTQIIIFDAYLDELKKDNIISPRHLVDVIAYSKWLVDRKLLSQEELEKELKITKGYVQRHKLDQETQSSLIDSNFIIYTPIEFALEDDGMRDLDSEYQKEIDNNIQWALGELNIQFIKVTGSPEERTQQVMEEIFTRIFHYHVKISTDPTI